MTIQTVRNGLIATIVAAGKWQPSEISACDFGVATFSGSSIVLQPGPNSRIRPIADGSMTMSGCAARTKERTHDISGIVMVKDPGDPTLLLGLLWQAADDIFASVNLDDTLNNTCEAAYISSISRPSIDSFITSGDVDFGFITFSVAATEYV